MPEPPVVDSSPLIHLSRANHLDLLRVAGSRLVIPEAVITEIRAKGEADPTVRAVEARAWLKVVKVDRIPPEVVSWDLGAGESATIAWARLHADCTSILDDRQARRCAASLGVPVLGTLGVVLRAKRAGLIPLARPVVEELVSAGMYLLPATVQQALALVGE